MSDSGLRIMFSSPRLSCKKEQKEEAIRQIHYVSNDAYFVFVIKDERGRTILPKWPLWTEKRKREIVWMTEGEKSVKDHDHNNNNLQRNVMNLTIDPAM